MNFVFSFVLILFLTCSGTAMPVPGERTRLASATSDVPAFSFTEAGMHVADAVRARGPAAVPRVLSPGIVPCFTGARRSRRRVGAGAPRNRRPRIAAIATVDGEHGESSFRELKVPGTTGTPRRPDGAAARLARRPRRGRVLRLARRLFEGWAAEKCRESSPKPRTGPSNSSREDIGCHRDDRSRRSRIDVRPCGAAGVRPERRRRLRGRRRRPLLDPAPSARRRRGSRISTGWRDGRGLGRARGGRPAGVVLGGRSRESEDGLRVPGGAGHRGHIGVSRPRANRCRVRRVRPAR